MGGAGWSANLVFNQLASLVVAGVYNTTRGGPEGAFVWYTVLAANGALGMSLAAFFALINRSHLASFVSFETRADASERTFKYHTEPELKLLCTVMYSESAYAHFRDDVKAYVAENVGSWEEERPLWWTDVLLAHIPEDMLEGAEGRKALQRTRRGLTFRNSGRRSMNLVQSLLEDVEEEDGDEEGGGGGTAEIVPVK
jgi:hypothetical protein